VASLSPEARPTCYRCHRPSVACVCAELPRVDNQVGLIVVQHPHERAHPLGTARLLRQALGRVEIVRFEPARPAAPALPAHTALLYPHPAARPLEALAPAERPRHLLMLDGTWSHAKSMYKALPALHALPHVSLQPATPSRYRVRREPRA
jgi:DTW domain-containing protein YfiP